MEFINNLMQRKDIGMMQGIAGIILLFILLVLFFVRSSRDERGRAIIGKANIISTIYLFTITTIICQLMYDFDINLYSASNIIQFIINTVIVVQIISILVLKKIK